MPFDGGIKLTRTNSKTGEREEQTSGTVYFDLAEMADWEMTLSFTLKEGDFTWGDVTKVTAYPEDNKPEGIDNQFHFAWEYSGPVTVVLNEDGSTSFMLTGEQDMPNADWWLSTAIWRMRCLEASPSIVKTGEAGQGRFSPDSRKRQKHLRP